MKTTIHSDKVVVFAVVLVGILAGVVPDARAGCPTGCPTPPCPDLFAGDPIAIWATSATTHECRQVAASNPLGVSTPEEWASWLEFAVSASDADIKWAYHYDRDSYCNCVRDHWEILLTGAAAGLRVEWAFDDDPVDLTANGVYRLTATALNDPANQYPCPLWYVDVPPKTVVFTVVVGPNDLCCLDHVGGADDCNSNGAADACEFGIAPTADCNSNGIPDACDIATNGLDCNTNGVLDECDIAGLTSADCNTNGVPDECDIESGTSQDADGNHIPDECPENWVDLDVDSDNDDGNGPPDRSIAEDLREENNPGKYVWANTDDDNTNGIKDYVESGAVAGEDDLVPLVLQISLPPGDTRVEIAYKLDYDPSYMRVWRTSARGAGDWLENGITYIARIADQPMHLWIEDIFEYWEPVASEIQASVDADDNGVPDAEFADAVKVSLNAQYGTCEAPAPFSSYYGVLPGETCDDPQFRSRCFGGESDEPFAGALNFWLSQPPAPGDFPPVSTDPASSTCPLVAKEASFFGANKAFPERVTHRGVMDMVTGKPLLQETDFALPFGSAVFRHVRTHSMYPSFRWNLWASDTGGLYDNVVPAEAGFWDWNGKSWMMSENPILLIDAQYDRIVAPDNPKRCYLIPDAHQSIPFEWIRGTQDYVAPSWFDATLEHDGTMDITTGEWTKLPTEFTVWLHRGSVKYTFKAYFEDLGESWSVDKGRYVNVHESTANGGRGYPYYGILQSIEDRYGNIARMHYCDDFEQFACDNAATPGCFECCQNCQQKGQLKAVTLHPAGSAQVTWTIVYVYREMEWIASNIVGPPDIYRSLDVYLHSIHVYEGYVDPQALPCLTLSQDAFIQDRQADGMPVAFASLDDYDDVDAVSLLGLPTGQAIEVKYMYEEAIPELYYEYFPVCWPEGCEEDWTPKEQNGAGQGWTAFGGALRKATVRETGRDVPRHTLYWYYGLPLYRPYKEWEGYGVDGGYYPQEHAIKAVFYDESVKRILAALGGSPSENAIFDLDENQTIDGKAPSELADLYFRADNYGHPAAETDSVAMSLGLNPDDVLDLYNQDLLRMTDNRSAGTDKGTFCYHLFQTVPPAAAIPAGADPPWSDDLSATELADYPAIYHYPYRVRKLPYIGDEGPVDPGDLVQPTFSEPRFYVVIDELAAGQEYHPDRIGPNGGFDPQSPPGVLTRRAVELNAAGFALRDRTWNCQGVGADGFSQVGSVEESRYDCKGRVVQRRSRGWSAAAADGDPGTNPTQDGVIQVTVYDDDACPWVEGIDGCNCGTNAFHVDDDAVLRDPIAVGVKKGSGGDNEYYEALYLSSVEREVSGRPELITKQIVYPEPVTDPASEAGNVTLTSYAFLNNNPKKGMTAKDVRRPAAPQASGGPAYNAVEWSIFDDKGNLTWFGWGSVEGNGTAAQFFANFNRYNEFGQPELEVVDAAPVDPDRPEDFPDGWLRVPTTGALNLKTEYVYDPIFGLKKVTYPNDRELHIVYKLGSGDPNRNEVWVYPDVDAVGDPGDPNDDNRVLSPVKITTLLGTQVESIKEVRIPKLDFNPPTGSESTADVISVREATYDDSGQITGVTQTSGASSVSASIRYFATGEPERVAGPNGTLDRYMFNNLGQIEKVYRGTTDTHAYWGTAAPDDPGSFDDNMILIEKRFYGQGVTDAGQLAQVRHYGRKPDNQYFQWHVCTFPEDPPECEDGWEGGIAPNEDDIGWRTEHLYDWRMREVWVTRYAEDQTTVVGHSLTWYDNLDRVVLTAEYGPQASSLASGLDPRNRGPADGAPSETDIGSILNDGGENLHSLTQNLLNARGLVEEARTYWHENTTNKYTATKTYYDHADRPVAVHTSGSPVQHYEYDAKNRQIQSWTTVGSYMLTKTLTTFDENDRPTLNTRYEAREGVEESNLTADYSVITYTRTWYDKAGRATATADYGTNDTSTDMFVNASAPSLAHTPAQARTAGARVTEYAYDEGGRQNWVKDPAGRVTATEYDGLGRAVLVTENAEGASGEPKQHTAYQYSTTTGQLTAVAAVRAEHFNGVAAAFINVHWDAADGTLQVTKYDYGASVVNSAGGWVYNAVSANGSWISQVHYPDPADGQPETDPSITFTYLPDGQVAERTDARGVRLVYEYDSAQRLAAITAADVPDNTDTNGLLLNVNTNVVRQEYDYTDDGLLETAVVTDALGGTLNDLLFAYDPEHRRLVGAVQGMPSLADREVEYYWETPPIDDVVDNLRESVQRLSGIVYAGERTVNPTYGASGSLDDRLNRVHTIRYNGSDTVTYRYMGTGRQVGQVLGNGVGFDYDAGTGNSPVGKLDRFGRVLDIEWTDGSPKLQYQYGYDAAGNRKFVRTGYQLPDQDWLYQYDALNRLVAGSRGTLNSGGTGFDASPTSTRWELDALGNWSAGANDVSVRTFLDAAAPLGTFDVGDTSYHTDHHATNQANEVAERTADGQAERFGYDAAGNLVFDGEHFYRYDAFNRVVKIQSPGSVHVYPSGELTGTPGPFVRATFEYDALGRRVRTSAIGGTPTRHVYGSGAEVLSEYALQSGGGGIQEAFERDFVWGTGGFPDPVALVDFTGAGGGQAGLLRPFYYLKDALGSVGALTDASGAVVERYVYTPYGQTTIAAPDYTSQPFSEYWNPFLWTGQRYDAANKLYHFWARTYSPELGRFLQEDEQGPLSPVDVSLFGGGEAPMVAPPYTRAGDEYADGLNLYQYVTSNPVNLRDPFGLSTWDDDIDNLTADITGQRLYALGAINEGARWASIGLNLSLNIASSLLGIDVFESVYVLASGKGGFSDAMNFVLAVSPLGRLGKLARGADEAAELAGRALAKWKKYQRSAKAGAALAEKLIEHHTVPRAILKRLRADVANNPLVRGAAGKPNKWAIPESLHKYLHGGGPKGGRWNQAWDDELKNLGGGQDAKIEDVIRIREKLVQYFGLSDYRPW